MSNPLLVILGPTAAGKTKFAVNLANSLNGEIISADSRQVFRDMDLGTGKDLEEYNLNGKLIPYHLINIKAAGEKYNVDAFKEDFYASFASIIEKDKLPILCGGTGMYIHSILQQHELTAVPANEELRNRLFYQSKEGLIAQLNTYPKELWLHVDYSSAKRLIRAIEVAEYLSHYSLPKIDRPKIDPLVIGLEIEVETRREKIVERLKQRFDLGLVDEVKSLLQNGISAETLTFYGLEYKFIAAFLAGEFNFETLKERLGTAIYQYAKRQMTFFRKMEKDGVKINWLPVSEGEEEMKRKAIQLVGHEFDLK